MQFTLEILRFYFVLLDENIKLFLFFFSQKNSQLCHKFSIKFNYIITSIYYNIIIIIKRTLDRIVDSHCQFLSNFNFFDNCESGDVAEIILIHHKIMPKFRFCRKRSLLLVNKCFKAVNKMPKGEIISLNRCFFLLLFLLWKTTSDNLHVLLQQIINVKTENVNNMKNQMKNIFMLNSVHCCIWLTWQIIVCGFWWWWFCF